MPSGQVTDEARKKFIIKLFVDGKGRVKVKDLSAAYGISTKTIYLWLDEAGINLRKKNLSVNEAGNG